MVRRETYIVTLRSEPGIDGIRALRVALKVLLRRFGLRCISITISPAAARR